MDFRIERGGLVEAVTWAARSLPVRSAVPVLGGLLLDVGEGRLRISGFDYEASASIEVAARSEERRVGKECTVLCRSRWSPYH